MKRAICVTAVAGLLTSASIAFGQSEPVPPVHPATTEQIRQLMTVTHTIERTREATHKMMAQQQASMPLVPAGFWTDFEIEMNKIDWVAIATPVYQKYLSEEDVTKAIAFYSTDAGQRALDSSVAVSVEMFGKGAAIGKDIGARLGQKYATQIEENMRKAQAPQTPQPSRDEK